MAYRSRYSRHPRHRKKPNILGMIVLIILILFISLNWILPTLVNGLGAVNRLFRPAKQQEKAPVASLAPPVILIPYEATNSGTIDISGYASSNSSIKIYLDDKFVSQTKTKDDGSFVVSNISLNLGTNNIYGITTDTKGVDSLPSKTLRLIYDSEKPILEVSSPQDSETLKEKNINVSGKTEPGATLYVNNIRGITNEDGTFSTPVSLNEGDNNIEIKVHDRAGNQTEIVRKVIYQP